MSEQPYTPTTNEVRNAYRLSDQDIDGSPYLPEKSDAEFDRWLAGVKAEAWEEGAMQGHDDHEFGVEVWTNPYRNGAGQ